MASGVEARRRPARRDGRPRRVERVRTSRRLSRERRRPSFPAGRGPVLGWSGPEARRCPDASAVRQNYAGGAPQSGSIRGGSRRAAERRAARHYNLRMELIFSVIQVAISIVLIFLVLMHSGKDAGLSGAFGVGTGQGPLGGGSLVERNLNRWTVGFAIAFAVNTILLLKAPWD